MMKRSILSIFQKYSSLVQVYFLASLFFFFSITKQARQAKLVIG